MWHTIVRHRITSKGQNYLADHVLWRSIMLRGEACQLTEGEACSTQGGPAGQQWLPVCHVRSDVPVKDRTLRPYQNTSLVMRSIASMAQSRKKDTCSTIFYQKLPQVPWACVMLSCAVFSCTTVLHQWIDEWNIALFGTNNLQAHEQNCEIWLVGSVFG